MTYVNLRSVPVDKIIVEWLDTEIHVLAACPHCGATGKKIYRFRCADGVIRGAMAGCVKLFYPTIEAEEIKKCQSLLKKYPNWARIEKRIDALKQTTQTIYGVQI